MPFYCWTCDNCSYEAETYLDFSDELPKTCPECGADEAGGFGQDYSRSNPVGIVYGFENCKTFGQVSEYNHKRLGKELSQKMQEGARPRRSGMAKKLGLEQPELQAETPWWRDGSVPGLKKMDRPLDLARVTDQDRYIRTGEE